MTLAVLPQRSTTSVRLHLALELSHATWRLAFGDGSRERQVAIPARDPSRLQLEVRRTIGKWRLADDVPIISCYEAGRDGFYPHRVLVELGYQNVVVDPASIEVDRRAKHVKNDRLDAQRLLRQLIRFTAGERRALRPVNVPSKEVEDGRRSGRERERLVKEQTQHVNRIKSLLITSGVELKRVTAAFPSFLLAARTAANEPLPEHLVGELGREYQRLKLVREQLTELKNQRLAALENPRNKRDQIAQQLYGLRAIGVNGAVLLAHEFFGWREFKNGRQVGALAGLVGTPYDSGQQRREQGISKAGNARVRGIAIELAWQWLRYQGESKLAKWFHSYVGQVGPNGKRRLKSVAIVALARKLLVALWNYLKTGALPDGAVLKGERKRSRKTAEPSAAVPKSKAAIKRTAKVA